MNRQIILQQIEECAQEFGLEINAFLPRPGGVEQIYVGDQEHCIFYSSKGPLEQPYSVSISTVSITRGVIFTDIELISEKETRLAIKQALQAIVKDQKSTILQKS